jgi:parvulin-like peptidyl-prolyl isomerase
VNRFEDAIIASLYKSKVLIGDTQVTETEVLHYYNTQTSKEAELNDDTKIAIEAMIRKKKLDELKATMRDRLRDNVTVVINEQVLSPDYDAKRSDADVVATIDNHRISWSQVKDVMRGADHRATLAAFYVDNDEERLKRLEQYIDNAIMTIKGRAAGLGDDPVFIKRTAEYRKTRLINEHRNGLIHSWNPSEDELKTYYVDNMDEFVVPERRKVQMVVVKTKEEAESIKKQIDTNEITMYQAAQQYSIDPNARRTLGDMGWVSHGTGFEGLDEFTFNLEPEVVSDPVESPAGWHLVKVLDVVDAQFENFDDPQTRQLVFRAYMKDKFDNYVVDLRKNRFDVVVYNDELNRQFQNEADYIAELQKKAQEEGSITQQRTEELQKWIEVPPAE